MKPYTAPLPRPSLIAEALPSIDYTDTFGVVVPQTVAVTDLPPLFFRVFPNWFRALLYLREALARPLGLKTAKGLDVERQLREFDGEVGSGIALFHVLGRNEEEILTGENDRHLDFCLSFFARPHPSGTELLLSTTVQFNATLGRIYFTPVRPIHRLVVPLLLRRMARLLSKAHPLSPTN